MNKNFVKPVFVFEGTWTTLNEYVRLERSNRFAAAEIKKEETIRAFYQLIQFNRVHRNEIAQLTAKYEVNFYWYVKSKRNDPDNIAFAKKFILDAFVMANMLDTDGWKHIVALRDYFFIDTVKPRVEVLFVKYEAV